jgi:hypothetical protein
MNHDGAILSRIFEITRGDLELAEFPFPSLTSLSETCEFLTISHLASFWVSDQRTRTSISFDRKMADFAAGMHGLGLRWISVIQGQPGSIKVSYGVPRGNLPVLRSALSASLPGVRFREATLLRFPGFSEAAVVVGIPASREDSAAGARRETVEKVCRGLFGGTWAFVVVADPLPHTETLREITDLIDEIRSVQSSLMLKGSAIDEQNRQAQRYVALLESKLKRWDEGRLVGMWNQQALLLAGEESTLARGSALLRSAFSGEETNSQSIRVRPCRRGSTATHSIDPITSNELATLTRPPREEYPGYELIEFVRFGVEPSTESTANPIYIGEISDHGSLTGNRFEISRESLTKHGLIVGVTGSGKTNTCFGLLRQVWASGKGTPFLVIESAKSEYRDLGADPDFQGLRVFTVADETSSPLRLNPFEVPPSIMVQTHVDYLKMLFSAAFVLYPPMPYVLETALQEVYEDCGWDLAANSNPRGAANPRAFPTLSELYAKIPEVVDRLGYDERLTMDVQAGLSARINQLRIGGGKGLMLDTNSSVSAADLFDGPVILELKKLVSDDEKAFLIGLILIRLYEFCESGRGPSSGLCHITIIEEAHRLLRNVSTEQGSEVTANPKGRAIEVFSNILSEIRAYGEGIIIAEQIPAKLIPDAIKNTSFKIVHRLLAADDRKAVGDTISTSDEQNRFLASLRRGEAAAFAEGMRKPVLVEIPLAPTKSSKSRRVTDVEIRAKMLPYHMANRALWRRFQGCHRCDTDTSANECSRPRHAPVSTTPAQRAWRAMLSKMFVQEAWLEFAFSLRQEQPVPPAYCRFVQHIEADLRLRGRVSQWRFQDLDTLAADGSAAAWILATEVGRMPPKTLDKTLASHLTRLKNNHVRLTKSEAGPYEGCRSCEHRCANRFEVQASVSIDDRREIRDAMLGADSLTPAADLCWRLSANAVFPGDVLNRRGLSLCIAVHQLAALSLRPHVQRDKASEFIEIIAKKGTQQ